MNDFNFFFIYFQLEFFFMKQPSDMLCEIIFRDHKLGVITSRIGKINESQFTDLSTNSKSFI
jgi:hypothetical protein